MTRGFGRLPYRTATVGLAVLAAIGAVLMSGCGATASSAPGAASSPLTAVHLIRTSAYPANHIPPLELMVQDNTKAQRLYDALRTLPAPPSGMISCPADFGTAYHLTFYRDQSAVTSVIVKPDGCRHVTFANGEVRWSIHQDQFWQDFAAVFNVPESSLFPTPKTDGPSAPIAVRGQP